MALFVVALVFREPIIIPAILCLVPGWSKPIDIGRHAFDDQCRASDRLIFGPGKLELVYTPTFGEHETVKFYDYRCGAVAQTQYNTDDSIRGFTHSSYQVALMKGLPLHMGTKDTILRKYNGHFQEIFQEFYRGHQQQEFDVNSL